MNASSPSDSELARQLLEKALLRSGLKCPNDDGWHVTFSETGASRPQDGLHMPVWHIVLNGTIGNARHKKVLMNALKRFSIEVEDNPNLPNDTLSIIGDPSPQIARLARRSPTEERLNIDIIKDGEPFIRAVAEERERLRTKRTDEDVARHVIAHLFNRYGLKRVPRDGYNEKFWFIHFDPPRMGIESVDLINAAPGAADVLHSALEHTGFHVMNGGRKTEIRVRSGALPQGDTLERPEDGRPMTLTQRLAGLVKVEDDGTIDYRTADMRAFVAAGAQGLSEEAKKKWDMATDSAFYAAKSLNWIVDSKGEHRLSAQARLDVDEADHLVTMIQWSEPLGIKRQHALEIALRHFGFNVLPLEVVDSASICIQGNKLSELGGLSAQPGGMHHSDASGVKRLRADYEAVLRDLADLPGTIVDSGIAIANATAEKPESRQSGNGRT